jgi:general secretion pathway protein L
VLNAYSIILRLPSRQNVKKIQDWCLQPLPFAITDRTNHVLESGLASVTALAEQLKKVKKVILIMAASDVTLLRLMVPPLSPEKLKLALPALIENSIIGDPATCHIVTSADIKGLRNIAVIDRAWLIAVVSACQKAGASVFHAYPFQLCLPLHENIVSAALSEIGEEAELSLRKPNNEAIGISLHIDKTNFHSEEEICRTLHLLTKHENCQLMVEDGKVGVYSAAANQLAHSIEKSNGDTISKLQVIPDDWKILIAGMKNIDCDLMLGLSKPMYQASRLTIWRLPLALAASLLVFQLIALHSDWWRLRQEKKQLFVQLDNIYKKHFTQSAKPEVQLEKLEEKLSMLRQKTGANAPEDFLSLLANTSVAWKRIVLEDKNIGSRQSRVSPDYVATHAMTAVNYRNHVLQISLLSELAPDRELAKTRFAENHLTLQRSENTSPTRPSVVMWHVQAGK